MYHALDAILKIILSTGNKEVICWKKEAVVSLSAKDNHGGFPGQNILPFQD